MTEIFFPETYHSSRSYFIDQLEVIKSYWPDAVLKRHIIDPEEDLSIDWIDADPAREKGKLFLITTGLHGVEGYVGAAMMDLFIKEFIPLIDSEQVSIILVHALNPWGMAQKRRFNANNVDLNRNYMSSDDEFEVVFNPNYLKLDQVLNPQKPLAPFWRQDPAFLINVLRNIIRYGVLSLREAVLLGQQSNPAGLYFSGREYQKETIWFRNFVPDLFTHYQHTVHLDMHTGYGPSDQMSIVISPSEGRSSQEVMKDYDYPLVFKADPEQFYEMQGDMVDWIYQYQKTNFPDVRLFSAACEFGTRGAGVIKEALSLRTMIYINQADQQGSTSERVEQRIHDQFVEMFFPSSHAWRKKAIADCRQAYQGILKIEGYI